MAHPRRSRARDSKINLGVLRFFPQKELSVSSQPKLSPDMEIVSSVDIGINLLTSLAEHTTDS